jgi:hypothetical protein
MYYHTGLNKTTFPTEHGQRVSRNIDRARKALDLDYKFGCAPQDYWMSRTKYPHKDSIFTLLEDQILSDMVVNEDRKDKPRVAIVNTGGIRFDIFKGPFTRDSTYIVSPFVSTFKYIPDVPYKVAQKVIEILNSAGKILETGPETRFMASPEQMFANPMAFTQDKEVYLELRDIQEPLGDDDSDNKKPARIRGYTTKDDVGTDGDDTVHDPIDFYPQPNCIQGKIAFPKDGEPETVDLVFIDFIQPWIIPALKFSGGNYNDKDVKDYMEGTFTYLFAKWISENWDGDC